MIAEAVVRGEIFEARASGRALDARIGNGITRSTGSTTHRTQSA